MRTCLPACFVRRVDLGRHLLRTFRPWTTWWDAFPRGGSRATKSCDVIRSCLDQKERGNGGRLPLYPRTTLHQSMAVECITQTCSPASAVKGREFLGNTSWRHTACLRRKGGVARADTKWLEEFVGFAGEAKVASAVPCSVLTCVGVGLATESLRPDGAEEGRKDHRFKIIT